MKALSPQVAVVAKVLNGRLETIVPASLGKSVVVLTNKPVPPGLYELELDDEESELLPLLPLLQTRTELSTTSMSMKVSSGLVTIDALPVDCRCCCYLY